MRSQVKWPVVLWLAVVVLASWIPCTKAQEGKNPDKDSQQKLAQEPKPAGPKEKDLAALQGDWKFMWAEHDGQRYDAAQNVLSIRDNKWGPKGKDAIAAFKIDPSAMPKLIDITSVEGKGHVTEGIYKTEGDMLIMCLYLGDGPRQRPLEFATTPGSYLLIYGWKRLEK